MAEARRAQSAVSISSCFLPGAGERIELRTARVLGLAPLGVEPSGALQPLQRGEKRARVHLEHTTRDLLDAAGDAEAVHGLEAQRLENEHVERALDDVGIRLVGICRSMNPTIVCHSS